MSTQNTPKRTKPMSRKSILLVRAKTTKKCLVNDLLQLLHCQRNMETQTLIHFPILTQTRLQWQAMADQEIHSTVIILINIWLVLLNLSMMKLEGKVKVQAVGLLSILKVTLSISIRKTIRWQICLEFIQKLTRVSLWQPILDKPLSKVMSLHPTLIMLLIRIMDQLPYQARTKMKRARNIHSSQEEWKWPNTKAGSSKIRIQWAHLITQVQILVKRLTMLVIF